MELTATHIELLRLIQHGADKALTNDQLREGLFRAGHRVTAGQMRELIHELRISPSVGYVLCASNSGYFFATKREEAEQYCNDLRIRNASQYRMESAIRHKTYTCFQQTDVFINAALLESLGFHFVTERTWYCPATKITIKKSSDEKNYPNHYGIFTTGQKEKPALVVTNCGELFNALSQW